MQRNLECPVDGLGIDEKRVRIVALFVVVFACAILFTAQPWLPAFLLLDFALRYFNLSKYSLLAGVAGITVKWLKLKSKRVDRGPKRFAALMGTIFSALILLALCFGFILEAKVITAVLLLFASLESFSGFCAGCYVYTWIRALKTN